MRGSSPIKPLDLFRKVSRARSHAAALPGVPTPLALWMLPLVCAKDMARGAWPAIRQVGLTPLREGLHACWKLKNTTQ